ncbi:MAG: PAS domain S-box protein [Desulfuromonadales bacterium]
MITEINKKYINNVSVVLLATILILCAVSRASALEKVTLQLKWTHQFQFAGYYAALQQGYFRDAGLDVTIKPATPGRDPVLDVIDGKAEYGVGTSSLLLLRNAGKPVVALAVIFQHSPYILLTKGRSANETIHSLVGKRLMLEPQADELVAYLKKEGITLDKMQVLEHSFHIKDLIDGKVDVISGYISDDPHELERDGFSYHAYTPRSAGIDFYGDNLFTTESELKKHPARVRAFREASLKGWRYALQHPDEIINLIVSAYSPQSDRTHLKYEAEQIKGLIQPNLVEIGYMHTGRWQHIADTYIELGLLPKNVDFRKFIYNPHPHKDLTFFYWIACALLGVALLIIAVRLIKTSGNLKVSEERIREQYHEIKQINESLEEQVAERTRNLQRAQYAELLVSEALSASELRFRSFVENANDLIYSLTSSGIISYVAPNVEQLLGYRSDELIGTSFTPLIHDEELPACLLSLQQLFESGEKMSGLEYRIRHKNGSWLWFVSNASLVTDAINSEPVFFGIGRDITEGKLAEEALRDSDELLAQFMLHSPIHTFVQSVTPTESRTLRCSDNFQMMLGISSRDMLGKTMEELFPPELAAKINADNWTILTGSKAVEVEEEFNGRHYSTIKFPINQRGKTVLAGYTIDITERILSEEMMRQFNDALEQRVSEQTKALQESLSRIDQLTLQSRTMIWEVDAQGLYTYVNHVSELLFGYRPEEMIGRMYYYDIFPEHEQEAIKKQLTHIFENRTQILNLENRTITRDGHHIWWTTDGIPILSADGTLLGYRGSDTDITESRKLKEQLLQSQKMEAVGQLAGGLAHDFNNVLSIINGYCCLLQMDMEQNEILKEYLEKIMAATGRAGELTHSMLAFSRTQVMNPQNHDLNWVVSKTGAFIEKIIGDNISFKTIIKEASLPVYVDRGQIEQILINLANNARDAMPDGGDLQIVTDSITMDKSFTVAHGFGKSGRYAVITISDTGTGMDEATRRKIFEPFFTTKAVNKGTGLGLAMVYGIVKQHHGFVEVSSEPGHGASFMVYLPIVMMKTADSSVKAAAGLEISAGTETVLIAEDSADLLEFMRNVLTRLGYQVICAVDGQDAVNKFRDNAEKIQLTIMDMIMPKKSGKAAYDEIRQIRPDARALFSSGYSANIVQQLGELGANAQFISKPVQPEELLKKMREMLDR